MKELTAYLYKEIPITKAMGITVDDAAYVPLHQQALAWGVAKGVHVKQRGDNVFDWRYVMID